MLSEAEVKKAKREAYKELRSLPHYVKNGVKLYSNGSAEERSADEELVVNRIDKHTEHAYYAVQHCYPDFSLA